MKGLNAMGDYITTFTGKHFYPMSPDPMAICIEDIAHALSLICRGNGHVHKFWSVAEHCICCAKEAEARGLSARVILACLLHDASECYMSDVPTPFKNELPEYQEQEEHLLSMVYEKFLDSDLTEEEQKELKEIDHAMLWYDLEHLLGEIQYGEIPELHIELDYTVHSFSEVEEEYLALYEKYSSMAPRKIVYLEDIAAEIVNLSEDPYMSCEEDKELWEEIEESDGYVRLPDQYELHEKWIMEHFAYEIGNERVSEMLSNALRKRHPYRAFKDKINELGISQLYYDYRSQAYLDKAEEWCRENSVAYRRK